MSRLRVTLCIVCFILIFAGPSKVFAAEVAIGYTGVLSGPAAFYGEDNVTGVDMAIREINAAGGITVGGRKYTFRLESRDDQGSPELAVTNAKQLVSRHNTPVIFNSLAQQMMGLLQINLDPGDEFIVAGYTSAHALHDLGNPLFVNSCPSFQAYIVSYCDVAWARGFRRGAMVVLNNAYGDAWRNSFRNTWERRGGVITSDLAVPYTLNPDDFRAQLQEAINTNPDFILIGGPSVPTALVARTARELGFQGGFLLVDQARMDAMIRFLDHQEIRFHNNTDVLESVIGVANIADLPLPYSETWSEKYARLFQRSPSWESALNYTMMRLIARAMEEAGSVSDPFAIREAIPRVFEKHGPVLGDESPNEVFGIEDDGGLKSPGVMQTVEDGRVSSVDHIFSFPKSEMEFLDALNISKALEPENIRWFPLN